MLFSFWVFNCSFWWLHANVLKVGRTTSGEEQDKNMQSYILHKGKDASYYIDFYYIIQIWVRSKSLIIFIWNKVYEMARDEMALLIKLIYAWKHSQFAASNYINYV